MLITAGGGRASGEDQTFTLVSVCDCTSCALPTEEEPLNQALRKVAVWLTYIPLFIVCLMLHELALPPVYVFLL